MQVFSRHSVLLPSRSFCPAQHRMFRGYSPLLQAFIATLITWGATVAGSAVVFFVPLRLSERRLRQVLDASLGFAGGVMLAASFWSLLIPAIDAADESGVYGDHAWAPVTIGLLLGGVFVSVADKLIPHGAGDAVAVLTEDDRALAAAATASPHDDDDASPKSGQSTAARREAAAETVEMTRPPQASQESANGTSAEPLATAAAAAEEVNHIVVVMDGLAPSPPVPSPPVSSSPPAAVAADTAVEAGAPSSSAAVAPPAAAPPAAVATLAEERARSLRRILLLVIAMTVHNLPEGLAVGVGFGALADVSEGTESKEYSTRFAQARALAIAISIQNLPEGLAVSLPLMRAGYSRTRAFMYGQLSGVVEPLGGVLGAALIVAMRPLLPYALAFAAGAMIYVVTHDVLPETRTPNGYPQLAQWGLMCGFAVMMILEVALA